ncbi:hypothetical protein H632_c1834p0 [Helicosporidium sp. ATCC 50920]|nr:hypothetical protein H632_c1834p0 [Helicosporidium sp. ATCC 50920]|eukprot:KDD73791.1 hypothetical protein H632_c1834p0 [Helicosporidium sp. ATCC 50920]
MALVATVAPWLEEGALESAASALGLNAASVRVASSLALLPESTFGSDSLESIALVQSGAESLSLALLGRLARALKPGGKLLARAGTGEAEALGRLLTLSGLAVSEASSTPDLVHAVRPQWSVGSKASISLKPRGVPAAAPVAAAAAWKLEADDELLDDEELLTEEDRLPPPRPDGQAVKKKACANCTCGRAEEEATEAVKLTKEMLDNPTSGCGSVREGSRRAADEVHSRLIGR